MDKIVKLMDESINKLKRLKLTDMNLHEITSVHEVPYFRKMRVESGFMYNFYDCEKDEYQKKWIFVPDSEERLKKLEHHEATTVGLWATDRPDLIEDPEGVLFQITSA